MKPFDFGDGGAGGVTGSVNASGRLIALNFYHPEQGYVTLTSAAPFPEGERYNPAVVRAYRASLTQLDGFGLRTGQSVIESVSALRESAVPAVTLRLEDGQSGEIVTFADARGAVQVCTLPAAAVRWGGRVMLQRCAYSQLTEGGPLPMPPLRMRVFCHDGLLVIDNPEIGAAVAIAGLDTDGGCDTIETDQPLELDFAVRAAPMVKLAFGVGLTVDAALANARMLYEGADAETAIERWRSLWPGLPTDPLVRRAVAYGLMMAIPVGEGVCLLTDHMLLPLSWNRDAYFVARALLSAGQHDVVRRHLLWTFETCERDDGAWGRCYTANGRIKDPAYQLDQQFYPLLELADYVLETGDRALLERLQGHVEAVFAALERRRAGDALLFPTDETPADDPIALPYHLSSHVLLWHLLQRLNAAGIPHAWADRAEPLKATIQATFTAQHDERTLYAYATDGKGRFHFYHDANDFPVALAPAWGFVSMDDPAWFVWRATIDFAFSDANVGGFYNGRLGSVHTRAAWPLGDVQDIVIARALGDPAREARAWGYLRAAAQPDGSLPEAYDPVTGEVVSRHWFAWPSAALACVVLGAFNP